MRSLFSAVLLLSTASLAAPLGFGPAPSLVLGQTPSAEPGPAPASPAASPLPAPAPEVDEDEDLATEEEDAGDGTAATPAPPAPSAQPGPAPATAPGAPPAVETTSPGAAPVSARLLTPEQTAHQQQLVSGAPLYNPNVAVHIVEKKQFSDAGKSELAIYPLAPQVNGKFVQHHGTALSYTYHVNENFGLQVTPQYNWYNKEAKFNQELVEKVSQLPQAASSLLLEWAATAGVEVSPFYGKFAFYQNSLAHFSFVINGGAGVGQTRAQIRAQTEKDGAVVQPAYGDTGLRFIGSIGAGFRVQIGNRFAFRLEARDLVYSAQVNSVNGCNEADLVLLDQFTRGSDRPLSEAGVRGGCNVSRFEGNVPGTTYENEADLPLALDLVQTPSSDVLNNLGFYTGFSFLF